MPTPADTILAKTPLPTHLDSREIRERWAAELRRRALFSAKTAEAGYLERMQGLLAEVATGRIDDATARLRLLQSLESIGYQPEPGEQGGLTDLASARRLQLIVRTQVEMAQSAARISRQTPEALEAFPAWRLARTGTRQVPRGDWTERWRVAGESVGWEGAVRTSLVARKDSPIWQAIGDGAGEYQDTLGNPYPPFAYSSGMGWIDVSADEAARLGLDPAPGAAVRASLDPSNREIAAAFRSLDPATQARLRAEMEAA